MGGELGKEIVTSCQTCHYLWLPLSLLVLLSHKLSFWLWNIHKAEEQGRCQIALPGVKLCFLPSRPCHIQCLCLCMGIWWWPWPSRCFLLLPVWSVSTEWDKVWSKGHCAHYYLGVVKAEFCPLAFCYFVEKIELLLSHLLVWPLTVHDIL